MRLIYIYLILILVFSAGIGSYAREVTNASSILPKTIAEWSLKYKPDIYIGDDLYLFINGGAEIYHEYGFKQAVSGIYNNGNSKSINVDLYEMSDLKAAYGIYHFKTSASGKQIFLLGARGKLQNYYLNLWKGNFKITLIGFDSHKDTIKGLLTLAKKILKNLPGDSKYSPDLITRIKKIAPDPVELKYFRGELTLFNVHKFAKTNLFEVKDGAAGIYKDFKIFIFKYQSPEEGLKIFKKSRSFFKSTLSQNFKTQNQSYSLQISNQLMQVINCKDHILIFLGNPKSKPEALTKY